MLRRLIGSDSATVAPDVAVPFGTEAGLFQLRGWPAVVCGPGSIEQAHQPDEWIAIDQLDACVEALQALPAHLNSIDRTAF